MKNKSKTFGVDLLFVISMLLILAEFLSDLKILYTATYLWIFVSILVLLVKRLDNTIKLFSVINLLSVLALEASLAYDYGHVTRMVTLSVLLFNFMSKWLIGKYIENSEVYNG